MPSTFPESFGMVAAEAAACGALPLSAEPLGHGGGHRHARARAASRELRPLLSFEVGPDAVEQIAAEARDLARRSTRRERERARAALAAEAARRYSWESVAEGVIAAAQGRLDAAPSSSPADSVPAP